MTLRNFIRQYRHSIDKHIDSIQGHVPASASCWCEKSGTAHWHPPQRRNDEERRQWILNDECLYNWARREGVDI